MTLTLGCFFILDANSYDGYTPLHSAARFENVDTIKYLLTKVRNKIPISKNGNTPLHLSVLGNRQKASEVLTEVSGQLEVKNNEGMTVLHIAVIKGFEYLVQILIRQGSDLEAVSQHFKNIYCVRSV